MQKYNHVFSEIKRLTGDKYHITLKKDYEPFKHPSRSVLVKLKPAYKEALLQLYSEGIIFRAPRLQVLKLDGGQVRLLNGLMRQIKLLKTFNTPWGKFRWLRLPFGLSVSSDIFQETTCSHQDGPRCHRHSR